MSPHVMIACFALFLEGSALSGINAQVGAIAADLNLHLHELQWVVISFPMAYGSLLILGGRCADRFGPKEIFVFGLIVFGVGSMLSGFAGRTQTLVIGRLVQGSGSALTTPAAAALIVDASRSSTDRQRAFGWFSSSGAAGFTFGILLVGSVVQHCGWKPSFHLFSIPTIAVAVVGWVSLPARGIKRTEVRWMDATMETTAGLMLLLSITTWSNIKKYHLAFVMPLVSVVMISILIRRSRIKCKGKKEIIISQAFAIAITCLSGVFAAVSGSMFLISLAAVETGFTPTEVGLMFLPQSLIVALSPLFFPRFFAQFLPETLVLVGTILTSFGVVLYLISYLAGFPDHLIGGAVLIGAGIAIVYPTATSMASMNVRADRQSTVSGLLACGQQFGSAFGVSLSTAVVDANGGRLSSGMVACLAHALLTSLLLRCLIGERETVPRD